MSLLKYSLDAEENLEVFLGEVTKPKYLEEDLILGKEDLAILIKIVEMLLR